MNLQLLKAPFPAEDIEWRIQQAGEKDGKVWAMCLAYVTARAIQDRLDDECGPENWRNEFRPGVDGGVLCGISIRINNEWVTKWDGAENTDIESVKGGLSVATKRAAVQWGIGRYLYKVEEGWAVVSEKGKNRAKTKGNKWFRWDPPALPAWALPDIGKQDDQGIEKRKKNALIRITSLATKQGIASDSVDDWCMDQYKAKPADCTLAQLTETYRAIGSGIVKTWLNSRVPS